MFAYAENQKASPAQPLPATTSLTPKQTLQDDCTTLGVSKHSRPATGRGLLEVPESLTCTHIPPGSSTLHKRMRRWWRYAVERRQQFLPGREESTSYAATREPRRGICKARIFLIRCEKAGVVSKGRLAYVLPGSCQQVPQIEMLDLQQHRCIELVQQDSVEYVPVDGPLDSNVLGLLFWVCGRNEGVFLILQGLRSTKYV